MVQRSMSLATFELSSPSEAEEESLMNKTGNLRHLASEQTTDCMHTHGPQRKETTHVSYETSYGT
jgi:hypothetical protein